MHGAKLLAPDLVVEWLTDKSKQRQGYNYGGGGNLSIPPYSGQVMKATYTREMKPKRTPPLNVNSVKCPLSCL